MSETTTHPIKDGARSIPFFELPDENGKQFVPGYEEIYVISNVVENGVAIGALGAGEASWHTDMASWSGIPTEIRRTWRE